MGRGCVENALYDSQQQYFIWKIIAIFFYFVAKKVEIACPLLILGFKAVNLKTVASCTTQMSIVSLYLVPSYFTIDANPGIY